MANFAQLVFPHDGRDIKTAAPHLCQMTQVASRFSSPEAKKHLYDIANRHGQIKYMVDVGACIGSWAMVYAALFPDAKILALEPSKYNYKYLEFNCKNFPNIEPRKIAAHDCEALVRIANPTVLQRKRLDCQFNTGLISIYGQSDTHREKVHAFTLDSIVNNKVDWLKIDVEGHELPVLQGAKEILSKHRPVLQVEIKEENQQMGRRLSLMLMAHILKQKYDPVSQVDADWIFLPEEDT